MNGEVDRECELIRELSDTPELLDQITSSSGSELSLQRELREQFSADLVRLALTLVELRQRGRGKFARADQMWFDRVGLEQATPEIVARHKALRFQGLPVVYDLCCGVGGDSIALAGQAEQVFSIDYSPAACLRTELNADVYGVGSRVVARRADVTEIDPAGQYVHIDPDRRSGRRRAMRLEDYQPSLEFLQQLTQTSPGGAMKLSPASNFGGKFPGCEIELVSVNGECKEATVWYGDRVSESPFRATILPDGFSLGADPWEFRSRAAALCRYLYDPDPAIVRSGLVDALAEQLGVLRLDDAEEYLTSDELVVSPALSTFEVLAEISNNSREIRRYFRSSEFGEVEIKCRHVPTDADQLRRKLPLPGKERATLVIARIQSKTRAVICRRVAGH